MYDTSYIYTYRCITLTYTPIGVYVIRLCTAHSVLEFIHPPPHVPHYRYSS